MNIGRSKLGRTLITMERKSGDRVELEETRSEKDLGVVVNNKLKWDDQVDQSYLDPRNAQNDFWPLECKTSRQTVHHLCKISS